MDVDYVLAGWSNLLIYSAMAVYAMAFIVCAFDLFGGQRLSAASDRRQASSKALAGTGTGATARRRTSARTSAKAVRTARGTATDVLERPKDTAEAGSADDTGSTDTGSADAGSADTDRSRRMARIGLALTALALLLHIAAIVTRTLSVMRVPWGNMMEYAMMASAVVGIVYFIALRYKDLRYLGTFISGGLLVTLGMCITVFYTPAAQLIPALQNYWIVIHVPIAILSTALLGLSAALAVFQILRTRTETRTPPKALRFLTRLPGSEDIEQLSYRIAAVGFVTWTFTLIAGAIWAELAWGRPWGWDTKEIWTFVVWVVYAAYLHARATRGWSATSVAWLNLIGFGAVLFNFSVVNVYFNGLHSYSGL